MMTEVNPTVPTAIVWTRKGCPFCAAFAPIYQALAAELAGRMDLLQADADRDPHGASRYSIGVLPTVILVRNGVPVGRIEGAVSREEFLARLRLFFPEVAPT